MNRRSNFPRPSLYFNHIDEHVICIIRNFVFVWDNGIHFRAVADHIAKKTKSDCSEIPDPSLCLCSSDTYPSFLLGPKPRPKAPSERNVFRLLGTKFAV